MAEAVAGGMGAGAGLGYGLGLGVGFGVLSEYARLAILWAKWKGWGKSVAPSIIASCLQGLLSAEKNEVSGLSSKGAVDTIVSFMDRTLDLAWVIDESIATQMFIQMIQQSIAYAIHSSHAGAIGTIGNVYSGSMYLSGAQASSIGSNADYFDNYLRGFLGAEVGLNKPTLTFDLVRGANTRIGEIFGAMMRNMDTFLDEWNDLALSYYRQYHTMCRERFASAITMKESATDRAYSLLEQVGNEHMARISEQLDTLEGAKAWWDAGLMSDDELKDVAIRVDLERNASETNYDDYKTDITGAITGAVSTWDAKITQALGDLTDNETKYNVLIRSMFDGMFKQVSDFAEMIVGLVQKSIDDVNAYRNSKMEINVASQFVTTPIEMYELEIYVDQMTVISGGVPPIEEHICTVSLSYSINVV